LAACANTVCISGSYEAPGQLVPPPSVPIVNDASGPPTLLSDGGRNIGPIRYILTSSRASARIAGVKSISSSGVIACRA
jgi:hypothetical protein